ncbi:Phage tail protein [Enterobacter kobei]|uniref:phage tail terminator protein n=1 Tax=Enterobacter cloacae complex TaxID=354276 RepID=UPI000792EDFB|nr:MULTISPECIES: phage tail terminator protein [Enterobacter cloacae complex]EMB2678036.1 phage tail protein [Enterobacter hormaechei subsp. hoffmannii]EKU5015619.1 phage tail protein [Enterobacter hormaechei]ELE9221667.1 phage tail protein [Enterobacter kobei]EMD5662002.1 phage tail protein [Enterobacter hormaechei]KZQ62982.1 phage tail protein [Enterobacter kobei]
MKHPQIRAAVLAALKRNIIEQVTWFDGRPGFLDEEVLPAVAVYLTDARASDDNIDEDMWSALLHIEVFLKAKEPDSALDAWMEEKVYPALGDIPELLPLIELMNASGYDYQRDDEAMMWGSADLSYSISYVM